MGGVAFALPQLRPQRFIGSLHYHMIITPETISSKEPIKQTFRLTLQKFSRFFLSLINQVRHFS